MNEPQMTHDFINRTNRDYSAWCATYYIKEALDYFGHASLHGLWAWQEQERRMGAAVAAEARRWASRVETLTAKVQATDERCTQLLQSVAGARAMQPAPALTLTCPNGNRSDCALFGADALLRELAAVGPTPLGAIGLLLSEAMDQAVSNGAKSVSMPDHYVEIAAWLARLPPQPAVRELTGEEAEQAWATATRPGGL